jgi:hypothetical protein
MMGFREAADFAAGLEEFSRNMEYMQVVAAGAVDRARSEASAAARAGSGSGAAVTWATGWGEATAVHGPIGWATSEADTSQTGTSQAAKTAVSTEALVPGEPDPADDGCRNTAEFLRLRLRIGAGEASRRLALAGAVLPRTGITGHTQPPERPELAAAVELARLNSSRLRARSPMLPPSDAVGGCWPSSPSGPPASSVGGTARRFLVGITGASGGNGPSENHPRREAWFGVSSPTASME